VRAGQLDDLAMLASCWTVIGSLMMPLSYFLTRRTSRGLRSMDMFLWMMPMPPSWAMAMARRASVTVSIAADTSGIFRSMSRVRRRAQTDVRRHHLGIAGQQQHVVEGEGFLNGDAVRLRARVSLYEGRGEFQLIGEFIEPAGAGALQARFEALRDRLRDEGLFDAARKRPLPRVWRTSPSSPRPRARRCRTC
jgi:hypothetical protein